MGVLDRPWFQHLIGPMKRVPRKFNDSTIESLTGIHLKRIPSWNYRVAVFNTLVTVLECLESDTPKMASDRARIDREPLAREKPQGKVHSIVTALFIAGCSMTSWVASLFQDEIKHLLRSLVIG